jgi:hypothetical protein
MNILNIGDLRKNPALLNNFIDKDVYIINYTDKSVIALIHVLKKPDSIIINKEIELK